MLGGFNDIAENLRSLPNFAVAGIQGDRRQTNNVRKAEIGDYTSRFQRLTNDSRTTPLNQEGGRSDAVDK